jgi:uncharacterized protein
MHSDSLNNQQFVLKIYASTSDRLGSRILYEDIVHRAKSSGIAGVTVYRGIMGYGLSSRISTSRFWELTEKLPVVIELIDDEQKLTDFFETIQPDLKEMSKGCLASMTPVQILFQQRGSH